MRAWLALIVLGIGTSIGKEIALNLPCNNELDGLLAQDPEENESAFLQCVAVDGVNGIGFWERKFCPNNMVFDFVGQQCKDDDKKHHYRKEANKFNIAILNNSCARGEQCIGGTVCDLETLRCLCPYGTQADLDTLSCITPGMPNQFSTFTGFKPQPSQFGSNTGGNIEVGFLPNPGQPQPQQQSQLPFNFNFNLNKNGMSPTAPSGFPNAVPDFLMPNSQNSGIDFKPNPFMVPPMSKKIPILAPPGKSCKEGELCTGGSLCTRPIGMCLCPGDLEERQGECVLPERAAIIITKVGIGAICGDLAECDHGSTCVNGRCMCVAPLVQEDGRCIMQPQLKEVGPLPAVAPWATPTPQYQTQQPSSAIPLVPVEPYHPPKPVQPIQSLPPIQPISNIQQPGVSSPNQPYQPPVTYTTPSPLQPLPQATAPPQRPPQSFVPIQTQPPQPERPTYPLPNFQTQPPNIITTPRPMPAYKTAPPNYVGPQSYRAINTPPPQSVKQNIIKLGGSKQAGVGVRCSLNTDCMVGAYCNGNTNPPSCQCLSTHVNIEGKCEKVIYPGQIGCLSDAQCTSAYTGTRCIDRICVCPQGKKAVDQTCVPVNEVVTSPPGGSCSGERECTGGSICREGWCVCPHHTMIVQKGICVQTQPRPTVPPRPSPPLPATTPRTFPTYPTAPPVQTQPPISQTQPPSPRQPIVLGRKATPGAQCGPLDTCVGGSMCVEGFCLCPAGSHASELGRCLPATTIPATTSAPIKTQPTQPTLGAQNSKYARPMEDCSHGEQCVGGAECAALSDGTTRCICPIEKPVPKGDWCVAEQSQPPPKKIGFPGGVCDENTVCARGSTCQNGFCRCPVGQIAIAGMCTTPPSQPQPQPSTPSAPVPSAPIVLRKRANPFDSCEDGEICTGGSSCDEDTGRCMCPIGMIVMMNECKSPPTTSKTPAFTRAPLVYGHPCIEGVDKCRNGATCIDHVCKCSPGEMLNASAHCTAITRAPLHFPPTTTESYFRPYTASTTPRVPIVRVETISPKTSENVWIKPKPDQFSSMPSKEVAIDGSCTLFDDCLRGSECIESVCQCPPTTHLEDGECVKEHRRDIAFPGDSCALGQLCAGGSICDNDSSKCICGAGFIKMGRRCNSKDGPRFAAPGDHCGRGEECSGGSYCENRKCVCDAQHYPSSGYCRPIGSPNSDVRLDGNGLRFSSKQIPPRPRAQECNPFECRLPECFCSRSGKEPPAGLQPEQIPQFVVLTFDDSVNGRTLSDYKKLFDSDRWFNPNGCPVKGTFFISHEWTNYDAVQWIHRRGHEIASNSITHTSLENEDSRRWLGEMDGMRRMLSKFGGADEAEVVGMRAPQLATGGDAQFEMMMRAGFLYDNTMTTNPGLDSPPYWPQTMDYKVAFACNDNKCPDRSFPGIWEIPINQFYGGYMKQIDSHRRASMLRAATHLDASVNELVDMLMTNFERAYHSNRAPYVLTLNADFLQLNNTDIGMRSFVRFMDEISRNKDVYFVTLEQLVKWMQRPTTLQEAPQSEALRCRRAFSDLSKATCAKPNKCMYRTPSLTSPEHQFLTCAPCPDVYPWLENPVGTI